MDILAIILSVILAAIAAIHLSWAFGSVWPGKNEADLARTVVGIKGVKKMPPKWQTALVAMIIFATVFWPLMWRAQIGYIVPQGMVWAGMFGITAALAFRGILGYLPPISSKHTEQPFARYNVIYYSPLCLTLAAGFTVLMLFL